MNAEVVFNVFMYNGRAPTSINHFQEKRSDYNITNDGNIIERLARILS